MSAFPSSRGDRIQHIVKRIAEYEVPLFDFSELINREVSQYIQINDKVADPISHPN